MEEMGETQRRKIICEKYGATFLKASLNQKVGISANLTSGVYPINGLRHLPTGDTTGWYIWAGDYSEDHEFFISECVEHLIKLCPDIIGSLRLGPGWRFLIGLDSYEDVWEDKSLLIR